jgi:predicted RNA-binding protein with PUA-like domain
MVLMPSKNPSYWLMKSEPDCFGIDMLKSRPERTERWDGVRNYQARNFIRSMQPGDQAFFYHSSCEVPGIYGIVDIVSQPYPDPTQFDPKADHYDPASKPEEPRWTLVDVRYQRHLKHPITLTALRAHEAKLKGFKLLVPGSRLSVLPVSPTHWEAILKLESKTA